MWEVSPSFSFLLRDSCPKFSLNFLCLRSIFTKKISCSHSATEKLSNALQNSDIISHHEGVEPTDELRKSDVAGEQVDVLEDDPNDNGSKNSKHPVVKKKKASKVEASKAKKNEEGCWIHIQNS